jgi:phosphohistidine phosphatase
MGKEIEVVIIRHAKTKVIKADQRDFDRTLKSRANKDLPLIARQLISKLEPKKSIVLCSTSRRTRQTLEKLQILNAIDTEDIFFDDSLYLASSDDLNDIIKGVWERMSPERLYVIGHNPGLTDLSWRIPDLRIDNLPTSGVICFSHPGSDEWDWKSVETKFVLIPKHLRS